MAHRQDGVIEDHPGAGIAHDLPDALAHGRLIAMHPAVVAEGLGFHKGAVVAAALGVGQQLLTLRTEFLPAVMIRLYCRKHHGGKEGTLSGVSGAADLRPEPQRPLPLYGNQDLLQQLPGALL